jgi:haloalkane dehalogenase
MITSKPYAELKRREVKGVRMAYIDEGKGNAIVFQHGQPACSYVWRNVMPHLEGMGRLVACDLVGMGGSDKLDPSLGPGRYSLATHRNYLFDLWDQLDLGNRIVLVLDDLTCPPKHVPRKMLVRAKNRSDIKCVARSIAKSRSSGF